MKTVIITFNDGILSFVVTDEFFITSDNHVFQIIDTKNNDINLEVFDYFTTTSNTTLNITFNCDVNDLLIIYGKESYHQDYKPFGVELRFSENGTYINTGFDENLLNENLINMQFISTKTSETTPVPTITPIISNNFDDIKMIDKLNQIHISNIALTISICFYVVYRIAKNILQ